jgi:hypothetical protein
MVASFGLAMSDSVQGPVAGCCEHSVEASAFIKCGEFLTS